MIKNFCRVAAVSAVVLGFGFSAGLAQAAGPYSCSDDVYGSSGSYSNTYSSCSANNTANQSSAITTSTAVLKAAATQSAGLISDRISGAMGSGSSFNVASNSFSADTGMAGGDYSNRIGAWVSGAWSEVEDDNTSTQFDGNVYSTMAGVDYKITPKALIGLALGYENTDIDTVFNGFGGNDGNLEADGYTIAPYVGFQLSGNSSANLALGYSDLEYDTTRYDPNTGNLITGSTDSERYFVDASLSGTHMFDDNWKLNGRTGVFYASEDKDAYNEIESNGEVIANSAQDNDFGQLSLDARLGYVVQQVEPYALAGVEYDFAKDEAQVAAGQRPSSLDEEDFGAKFGGGLNFGIGSNVSGNLEAYTVEFRDDYSEYTATGGLRVNF